jgi:Asp-tRNA(Asn)/Glu-tRNA(Gln) amidotransferase A subunit family amidase
VTDLAIMLDATVGPDPSDPVTQQSAGRIPRSYLSTIGDSGLGDITIGVVSSLFGSAPEDEEVATIVRKAIENLGVLGANVVDLTIPDYDAVMRNTSVINAEFKFDLMDFLGRFPLAPVKSLGEILASGKYDPAVEGVLRRAEMVTERNPQSYQEQLAARANAAEYMLGAMRGATVLAYPTLRRKPAVIGQAQAGSNCQLSASTGLPAISIPAGFTTDGLPVGLELLGRPFGEPSLLKIAYAYERVMQPRKMPPTTP